MPNLKLNTLEIMMDEFTNGFDGETVLSKKTKRFFPKPVDMERGNNTYYVRQDMQLAAVLNTFDVTASSRADVIQRAIPVTFGNPDNVLYELTAAEMRDEDKTREAAKAARKKLAWVVENAVYQTVAARAAKVIKKVGAFAWDDAANLEAIMLRRGLSEDYQTNLFMNSADWSAVAKDLGNKAYQTDWSKDAYARSKVPDIANFETFRTGHQYVLPAVGTVTGTTVSGNQSLTVSSMTGAVPTDNRQMTLVVAGANIANIKNGDTFTIGSAGTAVNSVHDQSKQDTQDLQTFRVLSGGGTANLVITPAIIITGPYQNCTQQAATGAAITFLNTVSKPVNVAWQDGAVYLDYGKLMFPDGYGPKVLNATTEQGVPMAISADFDHLSGKMTIRNHILYAVTVREPEQCGIILANQT